MNSIHYNFRTKKRQSITLNMVKSIRKKVAKELSIKRIAEDEDLSEMTVYNMANKISNGMSDEEITGIKKGRRIQEVTHVHNQITQLLIRDSTFNQKEISLDLEKNRIKKSQASISNILKKMGYTRKTLVRIPEERNSERVLNIRQQFAREIQFISDENIVVLDETGVNLHNTRNYGYSPKNVKAYKIVKGNRGTNISIMVAIKKDGIVAFENTSGAFNGDKFVKFITEKLVPHFHKNTQDPLLMGNYRFHHKHEVTELLNLHKIQHCYLPPYSSQLSPIEEYFSHFKAILVGIKPLTKDKDEMIQRITNVLTNETMDLSGFFRHMRRFVEMALAKENFI